MSRSKLTKGKRGQVKRVRDRKAPKCKSNRQPCGGRCLPAGQTCRSNGSGDSKLAKRTDRLSNLVKSTKRKKNPNKSSTLNDANKNKALTALKNLQKSSKEAGVTRTRDISKTQKAFIGGGTTRSQGVRESGLPDEPAGSPKLQNRLQKIVDRITGKTKPKRKKR